MAHYKTQFLILSFILSVPILYETGLGLAVTAISQYITSWLLTAKMVSSLDFSLQILIFPYCYHGVKAAGNENPLLHNGVWSFLHRDKQAFTTGLWCSTAVISPKSLEAGTVLAWASMQLAAHCLRRGLHPNLQRWGCAAVQHQLCHAQPKQMCLTSDSATREAGYLPLAGFPCLPPQSQGNSVKTNRG